MDPIRNTPDNLRPLVEHFLKPGAHVIAIRHARENTEIYGPEYQDINLVWRSVSEEESEKFYDIKLSFRPAGSFNATPGLLKTEDCRHKPYRAIVHPDISVRFVYARTKPFPLSSGLSRESEAYCPSRESS